MHCRWLVASSWLAALAASGAAAAQEPRPEAIRIEDVRGAIDHLGVLEFPVRMKAAQMVRRAPSRIAVPALIDAVSSHADGYVRFRALVLLAGFNDPRAKSLMLQALTDPNDRLRATAYTYFEHHPAPEALAVMLPAFAKEQSEFVRPALTRALAAAGSHAAPGSRVGPGSHVGPGSRVGPGFSPAENVRAVMKDAVNRGQDFFRSVVIEALGDYTAAYALAEIAAVAKLDGPLQDDAALALGKMGDKRALETLAAIQRTAPRHVQPAIAAGICLSGVNCASHLGYLVETLRFAIKNPGFQELLRSAATGLAAIAATGNADAMGALIDEGIPTRDPARAPIALGMGAVAIRNPAFVLQTLEARGDLDAAIALLGEAFDMLEEDFEEERFFVAVRRAYWEAADGSATRKAAAALIGKLEF